MLKPIYKAPKAKDAIENNQLERLVKTQTKKQKTFRIYCSLQNKIKKMRDETFVVTELVPYHCCPYSQSCYLCAAL